MMEQNRVADLESIVGEITSFGRTNLIHKPSNAQHNKGTEDTELVNAGQDGQYHLSNNTPQDEDQGIQTLIVDTNQSKASPTFASKDSIPSYQQRINFISRPESTRNDLSPGFAFGKAQLLKPLKFDRKLGQSLPERIFRKKSTDVLKDCCKVTTEGSHVSDNLEGPSLQPNDHDISSGLAQSKVLAEGNMETAYGDHSDGITTSQLISQDSLASHDSSHRGLPTPCGQALSNVSENARTTLLETAIVSHEGQESFVIGETTPPAELFPHQSLDTFINRLDDKGFLTDDKRATAAAAPPRKVTETVCQSPNSLQATPLDATEAETRSKSVQSPGPVASEPFLPPDSNRMFTDEKLIDVFVSRYRDQYQANVQAKAQEAQQAAEIQDLTGVCYEMHDRLARAQMEVVAKEKELLKYHEQVPKWQLRISKLSDYIRRLNSDHHNLRNGFRIIENQQKDLLAEKITLERSLKEIRYTIKVEHSKSRNQLSKARQDVRRLQETLTLQDVQLGQEISSLQVERDNSKRLQNELVRMNTSHKTVVKTLSHEGALLKTKMDDLLVCIDGTSNHKMSSGQAATREDVRDCFELLREVRKAETAREQDFQNLCTYMRGRFDQTMDGVKALDQSGTKNAAKQEELADEIKTSIVSLDLIMREDKPLKEQVGDLHEIKATLREQLKATEAYLVDARQHALDVEKNERHHLRKISALEAETALLRNRVEGSTESLLHTKLLEHENAALHNQLSSNQKETEHLRTALRNMDKDVEAAKERCLALNDQLLESQNKVTAVINEKYEAESNAKLEGEELKRQHSLAIEVKTLKIRTEHTTQMQQLSDAKEKADADIRNQEARVQNLQAEQSILQASLTQKEARIDELQQNMQKSAELVEHNVKAIQMLSSERDEAYQNIQNVQMEKEAALTSIVNLREERDAAKRLANDKSEELTKIYVDRDEVEKNFQTLQFRCRTSETQLETKIWQIRQLEDALATERSNSAQQATTLLPSEAKKASAIGDDRHQHRLGPLDPVASACQTTRKPLAVIGDSQNKDVNSHSDKQRRVVEVSQDLRSGNLERIRRPPTSESTESQNILMPSQIAGLMYAESPQNLVNITDMFPTTPELLDRFGTPRNCSVPQPRVEEGSPSRRSTGSKNRSAESDAVDEQRPGTDRTSAQQPANIDVRAKTPIKTSPHQTQVALREDRRSILFCTESSSHSQSLQIRSSGGKRISAQDGHALGGSRPKKSKLFVEKKPAISTIVDPQSPRASRTTRHRKGPRNLSKGSRREDKFLARFTKELAA